MKSNFSKTKNNDIALHFLRFYRLLLHTICMQVMNLWESPLTFRENESERRITPQCHYRNSSELPDPVTPNPTLSVLIIKRRVQALQ